MDPSSSSVVEDGRHQGGNGLSDANQTRPESRRALDSPLNTALNRSISWSDSHSLPREATARAGTSSAMAANEITPIMSSDSSLSTRRNYQSTDNLPNDTRTEATPQQQQQQQQQRPGNKNTSNGNGGTASQPAANRGADDGQEDTGTRWHQRILEKYGTLELENKGSVARDHLALERTFLAWLRTSLAFASIGIAVTQLFRLNSSISKSATTAPSDPSILPPSIQVSEQQPLSSNVLDLLLFSPSSSSSGGGDLRNVGKPLGATFIAIAIVILLIGFHRYFEAQYWIVRGKFPASRGSVALVTFVAGALIITSLIIILAIAPNATEL